MCLTQAIAVTHQLGIEVKQAVLQRNEETIDLVSAQPIRIILLDAFQGGFELSIEEGLQLEKRLRGKGHFIYKLNYLKH